MNALCKRLGIDAPMCQAPIGSATSPQLVAAVSNAGGLGMLAATWRSIDDLRAAIAQIRGLTSKPFAVNLGVHAAPAEKIDLCLTSGVRIISLFWGDAREYFEHIKRAGRKVIATIGSPSEATAAAEAGADAIITQGFEAGGHVWGNISTLSLLPEVREQVRNVPVIAAGGIGDAKTAAAAMLLGASGICVGTRFIVATESLAHPAYKKMILHARAEDTFYGNVFNVGWPNAPHRVIRNSTVTDFLRSGRKTKANTVAHAPDGTAIPRYSSRLPVEGMTGQIESMALYAGQSVGCCREIQPAAAIVGELMRGIRTR
jgi:nitronate monooxygenase